MWGSPVGGVGGGVGGAVDLLLRHVCREDQQETVHSLYSTYRESGEGGGVDVVCEASSGGEHLCE